MLEPYCRHWIQVPLREALTIKKLDTDIGHHYLDNIVDYWRNCIIDQATQEDFRSDTDASENRSNQYSKISVGKASHDCWSRRIGLFTIPLVI